MIKIELSERDISHVLINYACSVRGLVCINQDGSISKKRTGATGIFHRVIDTIQNEDLKNRMIAIVSSGEL